MRIHEFRSVATETLRQKYLIKLFREAGNLPAHVFNQRDLEAITEHIFQQQRDDAQKSNRSYAQEFKAGVARQAGADVLAKIGAYAKELAQRNGQAMAAKMQEITESLRTGKTNSPLSSAVITTLMVKEPLSISQRFLEKYPDGRILFLNLYEILGVSSLTAEQIFNRNGFKTSSQKENGKTEGEIIAQIEGDLTSAKEGFKSLQGKRIISSDRMQKFIPKSLSFASTPETTTEAVSTHLREEDYLAWKSVRDASMRDFNLSDASEEFHIPLPFHSEGLGDVVGATYLANHSIGAGRTVGWLYDQLSRSPEYDYVYKILSAKLVSESSRTGIEMARIAALLHDVGKLVGINNHGEVGSQIIGREGSAIRRLLEKDYGLTTHELHMIKDNVQRHDDVISKYSGPLRSNDINGFESLVHKSLGEEGRLIEPRSTLHKQITTVFPFFFVSADMLSMMSLNGFAPLMNKFLNDVGITGLSQQKIDEYVGENKEKISEIATAESLRLFEGGNNGKLKLSFGWPLKESSTQEETAAALQKRFERNLWTLRVMCETLAKPKIFQAD